jgi:hypothetical protein
LAVVAAVRWTAAHPQPLWWDEANYYNQVIGDRTAFLRGGLPGVARSLLFADPARPPAYRVAVLPLIVQRPTLGLLRRFALLVTIFAIALLAWAARAVVAWSSALLAAAFVFAMPGVLTAGAWFGTEYPLFLAVALLLASLLRGWRLGLAVAVALGLLSKTTFVLIGAPAILVALLLARDWRTRRDLFVPSAIGALAASGWWFWNVGPALRFGQLGRTFERASLGDVFSLATALQKVRIVLEEGLGCGVAVALLVVVVVTLVMRRQPASERWPPEQRRAFLIAVAATVPLLLVLAFSPVFVARHFAPALLPMTVLVALLLDRLPASARVAAAALALLQVAGLAAAPERFLPRVEQTDWSRLRAAVPGRTPHIAYLGNWGSLSPPEIRYGWTRSGDEATVIWLWRFEWRTIDWRSVEAEALASDAVLVVPPGTPGRDNQYNAELVRRLEASGRFDPPVPFTIGTRAPIELLLYRRMHRQSTSALWLRSHECRQSETS